MGKIKKILVIIASFILIITPLISTEHIYANEFNKGLNDLTSDLIDAVDDRLKSQQFNIAVVDFLNQKQKNDHFNSYLTESLIISLINRDHKNYNVIERSRLNSILEEHNLSTSGILKNEEIKKIGKILGADVIVMGEYYNLKNDLLIMAKIVSVKTGNIYGAVRKKIKKDNTVREILGEEVNQTSEIKSMMVTVPSGTTSEENGDIKLGHDIEMGKYEVTYKKFIKFLNEAGVNSDGSYKGKQLVDIDYGGVAIKYSKGSFSFSACNNAHSEKCPANVTWYGAIAYCNWISEKKGLEKAYDLNNWELKDDPGDLEGYRLPTRNEWEYAARGGTNGAPTKYAGSDKIEEVAWCWKNAKYSHPVGEKQSNELVIYDMSGNAMEWTNSYDGPFHVTCNSDWAQPTPGFYEVDSVFGAKPTSFSGFRLTRTNI